MGRYTQARRRGNGVQRATPAFPLAPPLLDPADFGITDDGAGQDGVENFALSQTLPQHYRFRELNTGEWQDGGGLTDGDSGVIDTGLTATSVEWQAAWFTSPGAGTQLSDWSNSVVVDNA